MINLPATRPKQDGEYQARNSNCAAGTDLHGKKQTFNCLHNFKAILTIMPSRTGKYDRAYRLCSRHSEKHAYYYIFTKVGGPTNFVGLYTGPNVRNLI